MRFIRIGHMPSTINELITVDLDVPSEIARGELITAIIGIKNNSNQKLQISSRLNLSEGDLRFIIIFPNGKSAAVHGVVLYDRPSRIMELESGQQVKSCISLFYTNIGLTFREIGTYILQAEYFPSVTMAPIKSEKNKIYVRPAITEEERELEKLTMNDLVGKSIALGDAGNDQQAINSLQQIADRFSEKNSGVTAALVLGNTFSRDFKDLKSGKIDRSKDEVKARKIMFQAFGSADPITVALMIRSILPRPSAEEPLVLEFTKYLERIASSEGAVEAGKDDCSSIAEARRVLFL
jgi:hypothetical protein